MEAIKSFISTVCVVLLYWAPTILCVLLGLGKIGAGRFLDGALLLFLGFIPLVNIFALIGAS